MILRRTALALLALALLCGCIFSQTTTGTLLGRVADPGGANISPSYSWPLWQTGVLQQTNASLGRYTSAASPRQMSISARFQF